MSVGVVQGVEGGPITPTPLWAEGGGMGPMKLKLSLALCAGRKAESFYFFYQFAKKTLKTQFWVNF